MIDISQLKVYVPCPKCTTKNQILLKQIERQKTITCSNCNAEINLVDKNGKTKKAINNVNKSSEDLRNTIKKFRK